MQKLAIDAQPRAVSAAETFRPLTEALGLSSLALNYYELAPGDSIGFCYHAHEIQEELFFVETGTITFDTENGYCAVNPGEIVRFAPGEFQRGFNRGDERACVLAIGAPRDGGHVELRRHCPGCENRTPHEVNWDDSTAVPTCLECGSETGRYGK